jgi:hypothetical protein
MRPACFAGILGGDFMVRLVLLGSLGLALLAAGVGRVARAGDQPTADPKSEATLAMAVRLRFPGDAEFAEAQKVLQKLKALGVTKLSLRVSKVGEAASAEVVAEPQTPSKRVAAVVKELLDCGITRISVEVKK